MSPVLARYVSVDVVGFTSEGRSVEAQSDIIGAMNRIVSDAVAGLELRNSQVIFSPAGDGICIGLSGGDGANHSASVYDLHLRLALVILELLEEHNDETDDPYRCFSLRVGVNQNHDNLVVDINGNPSLAGAGINGVQRIMDQAGRCQIMVGASVFDILRQREQYVRSFRPFETKNKHGEKLEIYQFIKEHPGLNTGVPPQFAPAIPRISRLAAYYMLHAERNRGAVQLLGKEYTARDASVVCLYLLALDSIDRADSAWFEPATLRAHRASDATVPEQLDYYRKIDRWVLGEFANWVHTNALANEATLFEARCFPTEAGLARLRGEWPVIAAEL